MSGVEVHVAFGVVNGYEWSDKSPYPWTKTEEDVVRRIPDDEVTDDVFRIEIKNNGDSPDTAFLAVYGYSEERVVAVWNKVNDDLRDRIGSWLR